MTQHQKVTVTIPLDLFSIIWSSKKPNQTFNNRIAELVEKGLATDDTKKLAEIS